MFVENKYLNRDKKLAKLVMSEIKGEESLNGR
jgi:hypothetical protein